MKIQSTYKRNVRWRGGSREIVIPKLLLQQLALGKYYYLNIWINQKWHIEISNGEKPYNHVNGTVLHRQIYSHGGSEAFTISHEIVETMETQTGEELNQVEIFRNKHGNIEFKPIKNTGRKIKQNKRLKISSNLNSYPSVYYLRR